ncbi:arginine--tRNA ligase [Metabacillus halosaccharovorans]|uniref:Arginine--tRNA ligase n=1 Tax=Metabacillus halosaccharovorans TaxID=930124 RepID=A0ABT3DFA1_9BACI|nr:arginine--tRNA ligase [Metabacillus halosaccharovorans]MCV9885541.1 arginine--tRNA ligase [Metabacillus halosaccharovorans]
MKYKQIIISTIYETITQIGMSSLSKDEVGKKLEVPPKQVMGDYAFPCFVLAKELKKAPAQIAQELSFLINNEYIERVEVVGPYLNFFLEKQKAGNEVVMKVLNEKDNSGKLSIGNHKKVTIDLSSPNIAKPFSMGHLRSTVIGNSLANIMEKCGYTSIRINHLGDWGTQFGKLITAYKTWGDEDRVKQEPIKELLSLYIRFHEEVEHTPEFEDNGRSWFKRLEDGDKEALSLWKWFREESLNEFERIYNLMDIEFDSFNGEAFYNDKMDAVVKELETKSLLSESEGAMVFSLDEYDLPPCLIKKSDGATLYATRDLAAALYRKKEYNFSKALYVVGGEQSLHFKQVFHVLNKLGYEWSKDMHHIPFGMMLKDGKKMSTRKGKVVLLEEVLQEAIKLAAQNIELRNPNFDEKEAVAKMVGVGAVIFHDLKNYRLNDVEFSLKEMLTFEGETGPYVQYTHARACSILRKAKRKETSTDSIDAYKDEKAWTVISLLMKFEEVIKQAYDQFDPSQIAKYTIDLAQAFNKYYGSVRILEEDENQNARIQIVEAVTIVLKEGLRLLGIKAPEQM